MTDALNLPMAGHPLGCPQKPSASAYRCAMNAVSTRCTPPARGRHLMSLASLQTFSHVFVTAVKYLAWARVP